MVTLASDELQKNDLTLINGLEHCSDGTVVGIASLWKAAGSEA